MRADAPAQPSLAQLDIALAQPVTATGALVADTGFRPKVDGFSFRNYDGGDNLTAEALQRMFGAAVCGAGEGTTCILTPPAQQWMDRYNQAMAGGGHCYGFSTLSLLFFDQEAESSAFGAPRTAGLRLAGNQPLQQEIAYAWAFQALPAVRNAGVLGTPKAILAALIKGLNAGPANGESYTLAFVKRDGSGGHAVTPYAVEDRGNDQFAVLVYDSNFPGEERSLLIHRAANTWSYQAAANPKRASGRYDGDAASHTLFLFPTSPALGLQPCPFCAPTPGTTAAPAKGQALTQVYVDGPAQTFGQLVIADEQGRQFGYSGGWLHTELPGVKQYPLFTRDLWADALAPDYFVPADQAYALQIDGSKLEHAAAGDIVMIGRGFTLAARNIQVDPDQEPSVLYPAADGSGLRFDSTGVESPTFSLATEADGTSYALTIAGADLAAGATADLALDGQGALRVEFTGVTEPVQYDLELRRIDAAGETTFAHTDLEYLPDSVVYVDYGAWTGEGDLEVQTDANGDGTIDNTEALPDEAPVEGQTVCGPDAAPDDPACSPPADATLDPATDPSITCDADGTCVDANGDLITPDAATPDVTPEPTDAGAEPVDPNAPPADATADPNAVPADATALPTDPNAVPTDPNAVSTDANAVPTDPNAAPADTGNYPCDPDLGCPP